MKVENLLLLRNTVSGNFRDVHFQPTPFEMSAQNC